MNPRTASRTATGLAAAALLVLVLLVPSMGAHFVSWRNQRFEDKTPVMETTADEADYDATYSYVFDDSGDPATADDDVNVTDGGVTSAAFPDDMRVVGVDLTDAGNALSEAPDYQDDPSTNSLVVQFPDTADMLWTNSTVQFCLAFAVERGVTTGDIADDDKLVQNYHVEFGTGKAVLWSGTFEGDADDGTADSKDQGTCLGASDTSDSKYEFGQKLEMVQVMGVLNKAYLSTDPKEPSNLYVKISGLRAEDTGANATETGDLVDFGVQFYTWEDGSVGYESVSTAFFFVGAIAIVAALIISVAVNPSKSDLAPHINKKRGA